MNNPSLHIKRGADKQDARFVTLSSLNEVISRNIRGKLVYCMFWISFDPRNPM